MTPDRSLLHTVLQRFHDHGLVAALGGSGLLYSLGLVDSVRDWDLTTDEPLDAVTRALEGLNWSASAHGDGSYGTEYRLSVREGDVEIDLIGAFTVRTDEGLCHLPTIPAATWEGIPVGSPEVWAVAYWLIGRQAKGEMLSAYLRRRGANPQTVKELLVRPLPASIRTEVESWLRP